MSRSDQEWGDFQTPPDLAKRICQYLMTCGVAPDVILEPTCGIGNFILAALEAFPTTKLVYGVEIQAGHIEKAKNQLERNRDGRFAPYISLHQGNIFTHSFSPALTQAQHLLILGNPPWITNAELGVLDSHNLPRKTNLKALNGLAALTGKSNFDISEYILIRLLDLFSSCPGTLALLCKVATARNIIHFLPQKRYPISNIRLLEIDAAREFGAGVAACLLVIELRATKTAMTCQLATLENPQQIKQTFGWVGNKFVSNIQSYEENRELDGKSSLIWRQGIKHDCAPIMELSPIEDTLFNGKEEFVDVEASHIYWLLKGSDLKGFEPGAPRKKVIVTQNHPGENTLDLKTAVPKLWRYLTTHKHDFDKRKSSIYRQRPPFSMFGIGDYSFKPYKVAISGLSKQPSFSLVCPIDNRPIMLDDTCYFLGFDTYPEALFTASWLNSQPVQAFLRSIAFTDGKRPFTKEILMRINVEQVVSPLSLQALYNFWAQIGYTPQEQITELDLRNYKQSILQTTTWQNLPLFNL